MGVPDDADDWAAVETFEDFVQLVQLLAADYAEDEREVALLTEQGVLAAEGRWAQGTPGAWLEAMGAWLGARYLDGGDAHRGEVASPSWRTFAFILSVSRGYE